jgi:hypothetical protein
LISSRKRSLPSVEKFLRVWSNSGVSLNVKEDLSDSELREKLAAWRIDAQLPSDFQQRVWKRIAVHEAANIDPAWLIGLKSLFISATRVSASRLALTTVVAASLIGTTTGLIAASRWNSLTWNRLEAKYVQSIDPLQRIPSS